MNREFTKFITILWIVGLALMQVPSAHAATFTVNTADDLDDGVCSAAHCSLREAINAANTSIGADVIQFNIAGAEPHTIQPITSLPTVGDNITIDATTQPGYVDHPVIEIDGSLIGVLSGIELSGDGNVLRGLAINRFSVGVFVGGWSNRLEGNFIGTDPSGLVDRGNSQTGIWVVGNGNVIGGTSAAASGGACTLPCNLISGNESGIHLTDGAANTVIRGNLIGTDVSGSAMIANDINGIWVMMAYNTIIGDVTSGNVISGNGTYGGAGLQIASGTGTIVEGNRIGTNGAGTAALPNSAYGVLIGAVDDTFISRNQISGNSVCGIMSGTATTHMVIQGNLIGSDASGASPIANLSCGISAAGGTGSLIGGTAAGQGNLIMNAGNDPFIGGLGISVYSTGSLAGEWLTIQGNTIRKNYVGIFPRIAARVRIGGVAAGAANVIVDNHGGIEIDEATGEMIVEGNLIGMEADGTPNGNWRFGIFVTGTGALIGGTSSGAGNVIANTRGPGIHVLHNALFTTNGNQFLRNSLYNNMGLSIDLSAVSPGWDGPNANDPLDADDGANHLQNFAALTSAESDGTTTTVTGTLSSTPNRRYRIEFFSDRDCADFSRGELRDYLGFTEVMTDAAGEAVFTASGLLPAFSGDVIASTATDLTVLDTSEPSACVNVTATPEVISAELVRLMRDIDAFLAAGDLLRGPAQSLKAPLQAAVNLVKQQKYAPALTQMSNFDRKVSLTVNQGMLDQKLGFQLYVKSGNIVTQMEDLLNAGK